MSVKQLVSRAKSGRRRGLTLMELVVVMVVLAALAAIVIPLFPNLLRRSHKVSEATQASELSKVIQLHQASTLDYPNEWDLMTASGTTPPDFLPSDGPSNTFGSAAKIGPLTAAEVAALERVGITKGHAFAATAPSHPTENPYANAITAPTTISTSTNVFIIDSTVTGEYPPEIANLIARDNTARFVVFGVGSRSTMVGKTMQAAPVMSPTGGNMTPSNVYSRFGAVFQVAGTGITVSKRARFIGTVMLEDDAIEGGEHALIGYYDVSKSGE